MPRYVAALVREMERYQLVLQGRRVPTLFFGGGTPSLLSAEQVALLIAKARALFDLTPDVEISLEANPGTLTQEKLEGYRDAGVNRLSLGVQSFQPDELRWLGRTHGAEEVVASVGLLKKVGFQNFNLDLIFGLPNQTLAHWQENVRRALALQPTHISLYHLTIEEGSTFGDIKRVPVPCDEEGALLFQWTRRALTDAQFEPYEISNYAKPGFRCRHNEVYWRNDDCVGVGAGAWTYFEGARYLRPKTIEAYIEDVEEEKFQHLDEERLGPSDSWRETLVFGLRTQDGVNLNRLEARYGFPPEKPTQKAIARLIEQGLLMQENETLRLTDKGFLFADTVAVELI